MAKPVSEVLQVASYPHLTARRVQVSYTRGTVIPVWLRLSSPDDQALDLLSTPTAPQAALRCVLDFRPGHTPPKHPAAAAPGEHRKPTDEFYADTTVVAPAVWWSPKLSDERGAGRGARRLAGEIHVPPGATPPILCPIFRLYVCASLLDYALSRSFFCLVHGRVPRLLCHRLRSHGAQAWARFSARATAGTCECGGRGRDFARAWPARRCCEPTQLQQWRVGGWTSGILNQMEFKGPGHVALSMYHHAVLHNIFLYGLLRGIVKP
jgi:hypothetical protein